MENLYNKTIQKLKELEEKPTKVEWNKIAKEKRLMSYVAIRCWAKKPFREIWREVKAEH